MTLSRRLEANLAAIERCAEYLRRERGADRIVLADIGSDHCLIPIQAVGLGCVDRAIASEVASGPFERASSALVESGLQAQIDLRMGNGLEVLRPREADIIMIAGIGGGRVTEILKEGQHVSRGALLVLQPMSHEAWLRRFLFGAEYTFGAERLIVEKTHHYHLLIVRNDSRDSGDWWSSRCIEEAVLRTWGINLELTELTGSGAKAGELAVGALTQAILELGPLNFLSCSEDARSYARFQLRQLQRVIEAFEEGGGTERAHRQRLDENLKVWKLLLQLLQLSAGRQRNSGLGKGRPPSLVNL